jgi:LmbE family N-acetylglucosaminyl deacetylase
MRHHVHRALLAGMLVHAACGTNPVATAPGTPAHAAVDRIDVFLPTSELVVVTNVDVEGHSSGLVREAESVASAVVLGLGEQDVIFLGYPDTILNDIYTAGSGTQVFTLTSGGTTTYGNRGLGGVDCHTYLTGSAGSYDRNTMRQDFEALIRNYRPDEI